MTKDAATLAFADLRPEDIVATLEDLGFECDGRFLALNSYETVFTKLVLRALDPS